jgi:hypothetical protein
VVELAGAKLDKNGIAAGGDVVGWNEYVTETIPHVEAYGKGRAVRASLHAPNGPVLAQVLVEFEAWRRT